MIFCQTDEFQEELSELLRNWVLDISSEEIKKLYSNWIDNFNQNISESNCIFSKSLIAIAQQIPQNTSLLGIDFPIWFNKLNDEKPKIILLGIDPLRNKITFNKNGANIKTDVIIGTPYALHNEKMRQGRTKQYWELVEKLSINSFVYITDIYKTFFITEENIRSYDYYRNNYSSNDLLQKEIDMIKPDLIITLGGESYRNLMGLPRPPQLVVKIKFEELPKYKNTIKVLPMVHLSGSTRAKSIKDFINFNDGNCDNKKYGEEYYNIINRFLLQS